MKKPPQKESPVKIALACMLVPAVIAGIWYAEKRWPSSPPPKPPTAKSSTPAIQPASMASSSSSRFIDLDTMGTRYTQKPEVARYNKVLEPFGVKVLTPYNSRELVQSLVTGLSSDGMTTIVCRLSPPPGNFSEAEKDAACEECFNQESCWALMHFKAIDQTWMIEQIKFDGDTFSVIDKAVAGIDPQLHIK